MELIISTKLDKGFIIKLHKRLSNGMIPELYLYLYIHTHATYVIGPSK